MIGKATFSEIKSKFPFISEFPDKLQDLISDKISPDSEIEDVYKVTISKKPGCMLIEGNKISVFWMSKFLFKKFPTIQEFTFSQINEIKNIDEAGLFIHASADPNVRNENYEEGDFMFGSQKDRDAVSNLIMQKSGRL